MSLTCRVRIVLNNITVEKAAAVKESLEPDNINFPKGLSLHTEDIDGGLAFIFESKQDMKKMIGTIDEVLGHVHIALKVMK